MSEYVPEDAEAFERMMKMFSACESASELKAATVLYLFDLSYPRADLMMALKLTEREKGFKVGKL